MNRIMVWKGIRSLAALGLAVIVFSSIARHSSADTPQSYVSIGNARASEIYWHTDLRSGWAEAHQRKLPMVIFITSNRCHYCDAMKRDTWRNDSIRRQIAGGFVAIELNPQRNAETLARIDVPAYPTTLLGIPDGKVIAHRVGYQQPNQLRGLLAEADSHLPR